MLKRTLEPEVMDSHEEAVAYDEMSHEAVNELFVTDLLTAGLPAGEILDLGAGTGRIPIELSKREEEARIVAIDLSVSMLDIARINIELAGLTDQINLDRVDAKELPYDDDRFAVVMSNSIVHHIPNPEPVIREAVRVTAPGGLLFFRDLSRPATAEIVDEFVEKYAGEESAHAQQMFRDSLHAALSLDEIRDLVGGIGFPANSVTANSDRHWTWVGRKPGP